MKKRNVIISVLVLVLLATLLSACNSTKPVGSASADVEGQQIKSTVNKQSAGSTKTAATKEKTVEKQTEPKTKAPDASQSAAAPQQSTAVQQSATQSYTPPASQSTAQQPAKQTQPVKQTQTEQPAKQSEPQPAKQSEPAKQTEPAKQSQTQQSQTQQSQTQQTQTQPVKQSQPEPEPQTEAPTEPPTEPEPMYGTPEYFEKYPEWGTLEYCAKYGCSPEHSWVDYDFDTVFVDKPIYEYHTVCGKCGAFLEGLPDDEYGAHLYTCGVGCGGKDVCVGYEPKEFHRYYQHDVCACCGKDFGRNGTVGGLE